MAVVAILGVVIVLDDVSVDVASPGDQRPTTQRREDSAGGKLVRRGNQRGAAGERRTLLDDDAVAVDRDGVVAGAEPVQLGRVGRRGRDPRQRTT